MAKNRRYSPPDESPAYPRWRYRHVTVLRIVIAHPEFTNAEIAARTGYGPTHISRIRNSPDFMRALSTARTRAMSKLIAQKYLGVKPRF
jgi:hypothetical protein